MQKKKAWILIAGSVLLLALLVGVIIWKTGQKRDTEQVDTADTAVTAEIALTEEPGEADTTEPEGNTSSGGWESESQIDPDYEYGDKSWVKEAPTDWGEDVSVMHMDEEAYDEMMEEREEENTPAAKMINKAYEHLGMSNTELSQKAGLPEGADLSSYFFTYCAVEAEIPESVIPSMTTPAEAARWFKNKDAYHDRETDPSIGNFVFFSSDGTMNGIYKMSLVVQVEDNTLYFLMAGAGNALVQEETTLDNEEIVGYGEY